MASAMDAVKAGKRVVTVVFLPDSAGCLPIVRTAKRGTWEYPCGKVEPTDTSAEHAAARETLEETGLHVLPEDLVCIGVLTFQATPQQLSAGYRGPLTYLLFRAHCFSGVLRSEPTEEIVETQWWFPHASDPSRFSDLHWVFTSIWLLHQKTAKYLLQQPPSNPLDNPRSG